MFVDETEISAVPLDLVARDSFRVLYPVVEDDDVSTQLTVFQVALVGDLEFFARQRRGWSRLQTDQQTDREQKGEAAHAVTVYKTRGSDQGTSAYLGVLALAGIDAPKRLLDFFQARLP